VYSQDILVIVYPHLQSPQQVIVIDPQHSQVQLIDSPSQEELQQFIQGHGHVVEWSSIQSQIHSMSLHSLMMQLLQHHWPIKGKKENLFPLKRRYVVFFFKKEKVCYIVFYISYGGLWTIFLISVKLFVLNFLFKKEKFCPYSREPLKRGCKFPQYNNWWRGI
jgi:hypothetical protein